MVAPNLQRFFVAEGLHTVAPRQVLCFWSPPVTAQEFLIVSTKLFNDMKAWIAEAGKDGQLSTSDLAMLNSTMKIVEKVTLTEAEIKPGRDIDGHN